MKRILFLSLFAVTVSLGQISKNAVTSSPVSDGRLVEVECTVDSLNIYYTNAFSFSGYDGTSYYTTPIYYAKLLTSVKGTPKVSVIVQGKVSGEGWSTVDTVAIADSVETAASGSLDFNGKRFPQYRLKLYGATSNRSDSQYKIGLYLPWTREN